MNSEVGNELVEFFAERPELRETLIFPGTFIDYSKDIINNLKGKTNKGLILAEILKEAKRILGNEICLDRLENQLLNYPFISYADHHGLLNFKYLYNSNMLYSLIVKELDFPLLFVLATGNIPLKNISYPRGFYFKGKRFNFFRKKERDIPVFLTNKLTLPKERCLENLILNLKKEGLTEEEERFIEFLFFEALEIEKVVQNYDSFSDQVTFMNFKLWKYYFDQSVRDSIPEIIYLQSNKIVLNTLLKELENRNSLVFSILFDPRIRAIYLRNFHGIKSCWGDNMGSHFFWGISDKKKYVPLYLDEVNNILEGNGFSIPLESEVIINELRNQKILPTLFFDFLMITFIEGYLAMGGMNQIEFLPKMQKAHMKSLIEIGEIEKAAELAEPVANGLICGMMPFDFDSGIDLIWHYNSTNGKFNGNLDRGLTQEDLDRVNNTLVTELIATGIDKTLGIP